MSKKTHYCDNCFEKIAGVYDENDDVYLCLDCAEEEYVDRAKEIVSYEECGLIEIEE